MWIAYAMDRIGDNHDEMWDEEDGFYYDVLRLPDGSAQRLKVRSMVGLLPLCASTTFDPEQLGRHPHLVELIELMRERYPEVVAQVAPTGAGFIGYDGRRLLSPLSKQRLERILRYMLDENEFLGEFRDPIDVEVPRGRIRSPSAPSGRRRPCDYVAGRVGHGHVRRQFELARAGLDACQRLDRARPAQPVLVLRRRIQGRVPDRFGRLHDALRGRPGDLASTRADLPAQTRTGKRPVYGGATKFQEDPHWRDYILFYEYFHGDNGAGLGASHQTGWTGIIARLMDVFGRLTPDAALDVSKSKILGEMTREGAEGVVSERVVSERVV